MLSLVGEMSSARALCGVFPCQPSVRRSASTTGIAVKIYRPICFKLSVITLERIPSESNRNTQMRSIPKVKIFMSIGPVRVVMYRRPHIKCKRERGNNSLCPQALRPVFNARPDCSEKGFSMFIVVVRQSAEYRKQKHLNSCILCLLISNIRYYQRWRYVSVSDQHRKNIGR